MKLGNKTGIGAALALFGLLSAGAQTAAAAPQQPAVGPAKMTPAIAQAIHDMFSVHEFSQTAISPGGRRVAWVESLNKKNGAPSPNSAIYVENWETRGNPVRVTAARGGAVAAENSIAWSPDGKQIAFLSDAGHNGQKQLYVAAPGETARQLTHLTGALSDPSWSPGGRTIALLFVANAPGRMGPLAAEHERTGVIGSKIYEQRIALVDVATGRVREISPANLYVYEYDWAPDGKQLVGTAAHGRGDDNWWIARLYVFSRETGAARVIYRPPASLQMAHPTWSPDGRTIAFIGGIMSDEIAVGGDVYTVPATGGEARDASPGMKATANSIVWAPDSRSITFGEIVDGETGIASLDPASGSVHTLWRGPEHIGGSFFGVGLSLSRNGEDSAMVRQSFSEAPEVWAGPVGHWRQVTFLNRNLRPAWGEAKSLHWTTGIGTVQGWLVYPRDYNPAKQYPMVVCVHGGPASANLPGWPGRGSYQMALPAAGYFLLFPNPRGSYGEGEAFTRANVKDFGYGDFRDILAGVDAALQAAPIDPIELGITGWSYGGYMTMWAVTHTHRFQAAMAGAGLSDWLSYYGENQIDRWMIPYFGASVYDDPGVYAKSAPINFVKNVNTPTLMQVGHDDGECPAPQSYEFWHALRTLGVPTELVVYAHEGHGFIKPADDREVTLRTLGWFNHYLLSAR